MRSIIHFSVKNRQDINIPSSVTRYLGLTIIYRTKIGLMNSLTGHEKPISNKFLNISKDQASPIPKINKAERFVF